MRPSNASNASLAINRAVQHGSSKGQVFRKTGNNGKRQKNNTLLMSNEERDKVINSNLKDSNLDNFRTLTSHPALWYFNVE